jgi:hypothetical protein
MGVIEENLTEWLVIGQHSKPLEYKILCRVHPLLGNDTVNTFPRKQTRRIGCPLLANGSVNIPP